jgi:hypothetical protein
VKSFLSKLLVSSKTTNLHIFCCILSFCFFRSGSVVVDYRISWKNQSSEITADMMMAKIQSYLSSNNQQLLSRYLVNESTIRTARVPDLCSTADKNQCDHDCEFSVDRVDFTCTCPENMTFDEDFKECVNDDDSIFDASRDYSPDPETTSENYHLYGHRTLAYDEHQKHKDTFSKKREISILKVMN